MFHMKPWIRTKLTQLFIFTVKSLMLNWLENRHSKVLLWLLKTLLLQLKFKDFRNWNKNLSTCCIRLRDRFIYQLWKLYGLFCKDTQISSYNQLRFFKEKFLNKYQKMTFKDHNGQLSVAHAWCNWIHRWYRIRKYLKTVYYFQLLSKYKTTKLCRIWNFSSNKRHLFKSLINRSLTS